MPFVEVNVKEEIEKQRQNNPEFKKAWDESRKEYESIGKTIAMQKQVAFSKLEDLKKNGTTIDYDTELISYRNEKYNHIESR